MHLCVLSFSVFMLNQCFLHTGPKGDNAGDSQDDDGTEEEEIAVGRVNDGEDDDIEDERETGVITGGVEESWTVSSTLFLGARDY